MVSTRGGARTRAEDPKSTMLAQKPRRATAKTTQTTTTKAKTTRSKKAAPEPEPEQTEDELQEQQEEEAPAPVKKATRKTAPAPAAKAKAEAPKPTRTAARGVKKDDKKDEPAAPTTRTAARVTRTATTRTTKAKSTEEGKPELPPPAEKKATRATRATASKAKAAPLSPKKITQVSKVPARTTRTAATKASTAKQSAKPAPKGRPAMRRNVSDENAEAKELKSAKDDEPEEEIETTRKLPKRKAAQKPAAGPVEEEPLASSAPTTPSRESDHYDEGSDDELQEEAEQNDEEPSESEDEAESRDASGDELCGPKTPMKRCSPREGSRYVSPQKAAQSLDSPMKTPLKRNAVPGATPQTQRAYSKPSFAMSEVKRAPTTVARARDRAMVFPKLERLPEAEVAARSVAESEEEDVKSADGAQIDMEVELEEFEDSLISNIASADDTMFGEHVDTESIKETADVAPVNEEHMETIVDESSESLENPDETIVQDLEEDAVLGAEEELVDGSDDSVIVAHEEAEEDIAMDDIETSASIAEPETMVWENIRQDVTIPFNFDADLTAQALPQVEHNERLSIVSGLISSESPELDAHRADAAHVPAEAVTEERLSIGSARLSLGGDPTVNISDFINVQSLSESSTITISDAETVNVTEMPQSDNDESMDCNEQDISRAESLEEPAPATPARDAVEEPQAVFESRGRSLPRYAMPTMASRSKSLPASPYRTPLKDGDRPKTSDGFSMPRLTQPFQPSWLRSPSRRSTPARPRTSTITGVASTIKRGKSRTPAARIPFARTPGTSVPENSKHWKKQSTPVSRTVFARTPGTSVPENITPIVKERFPGLPARRTYEEFASDEGTGMATPKPAIAVSASKERFPGLPPSQTYEDLLETPVQKLNSPKRTPATRKSTRKERFPGLPSRDTYEELDRSLEDETPPEDVPATPQPAQEEKFPGLPAGKTYEEHAKTTMPASRFRTPPKLTVAKRPATTQKPTSLRKIALKASTPQGSRTPMKTPLRGTAKTPGQELMTPHPAAPLCGMVALVEVYTSDGSCATPAFTVLLQRLGAKTTKTFSERVTHIVFKEGSPQTLQRLRMHNKQVASTGIGNEIHCVNSRWVNDCDSHGARVDETDEIYAVDMGEGPQSAKRRRKSMEPMSLLNNNGNIVSNRKSSLGRSSLGRLKSLSPAGETPQTEFSIAEKENSVSPATPAYLAAPESLVMQTEAPKRVKNLDFGDKEEKSRRQTFWAGEF